MATQPVIEMLNEHLANAIDLQLQAKQAHWNIKGPNFVGLHDLFDRVAAEATAYADVIAERAVALGGGVRRAIDAATALKDANTADLFTEISRGTDKTLWMIEAHVQEAPES